MRVDLKIVVALLLIAIYIVDSEAWFGGRSSRSRSSSTARSRGSSWFGGRRSSLRSSTSRTSSSSRRSRWFGGRRSGLRSSTSRTSISSSGRSSWFGGRRSSLRSSTSRTSSSSRRSGWSGGRRSSLRSSTSRTSIPSKGGSWFGGRRSSLRSSTSRTSSSKSGGWFSGRRPSSRRTPSSSRKSSSGKWFSRFLSSSSDSSSKSFPHDIKTKSGLTELYNQKVVSVQPVERPLGGSKIEKNDKILVGLANLGRVKTSISGQKDRVMHSGVRVTLQDGRQYLIHKGKGFGKSSQTVVVDAKHMGKSWQNVGKSRSGNGENIGSFVKAGGKDYNWHSDNCHDATDRMKKLGKRKKRSSCAG